MAAGNVTDGVGHGQDGQSEGQGGADEANSELDGVVAGSEEHRREDRAAAAAEDKPEMPKNSAVSLFLSVMIFCVKTSE
jgi:hypothetical protein